MKSLRIVVTACILIAAGITIAPTVQATHDVPDEEFELVNQVVPTAGAVSSCSGSNYQGPTLTAGTQYTIISGRTSGGLLTTTWSVAGTGTIFTTTTAGTLGSVNVAASPKVVQWTNQTGSPTTYYFAIRFTAPTTGQLTGSCAHATGADGVLNTWSLPAGVTVPHGYVSTVTFNPANPSIIVGYVLITNTERTDESAIIASEIDADPSSTQVTWTRLNRARDFASSVAAGSAGDDVLSNEFFQTVTVSQSHGEYLEDIRFHPTGSGTCSGQLSISVVSTPTFPHSTSIETANLTASFEQVTSGGPDITVNFVDGTFTDDLGSVTIGTPTFSIAGQTRSWSSAPALGDGYAIRIKFWSYSCSVGGPITMGYSTGSVYSGGSLFTRTDGSPAVTDEAVDLLRIRASAYGGVETVFFLNANARNVAGAYHALVRERQNDADPWRSINDPESWFVTSSESGRSIQIGGQITRIVTGTGTPGQRESETLIRLFYPTPDPYTSSENWTLTVNQEDSGGNVLHYGVLAGTQPANPHVSTVSFTRHAGSGSFSTIFLLSTNDYNATLHLIVRQCSNADCSTFGDRVGTVTYEVLVRSDFGTAEAGRTETGATSVNGEFNVTGQDLPGKTIRVTLTKTGYTETPWEIEMPGGSGTSTFTIGIFLQGSADGGATLAEIVITFTPEDGRFDTGETVSVDIERDRSDDLIVGFYRLDSLGNAVPITDFYGWTASQDDTITFEYPNGRVINSGDSGSYILAVLRETASDATGSVIDYTRVGVNREADFVVGITLISDINEATQEILSTQNLAAVTTEEVEATVYDYYLEMLEWAFRIDVFFPNMVMLLCVFLAFAMVMRFYASRRDGP